MSRKGPHGRAATWPADLHDSDLGDLPAGDDTTLDPRTPLGGPVDLSLPVIDPDCLDLPALDDPIWFPHLVMKRVRLG